ncbi:MAG: hypothetical protein VKN72_29115 [Nostocales cyanobacterium 94392]|nr:hypothetical protein [Nostocales cyanobacterium 94392]
MKFNQNTPILYYEPKSQQGWRDRRFFLYPVWMYRVVAPRTTYNKLNILEKAILGLSNAGVQSAEEIGMYLGIHEDLAAHIISELINRKLIDNYGIPTGQGKQLLDDEIFTTEEPVAGYVFQDVWTNELMPRFIDTEERADTRLNASGFPELNLGSIGKPNYQTLVMPKVDNVSCQTPSAKDILKAVHRHSKAIEKLASNTPENDDNIPEESWHDSQLHSLKRISFIEEDPIPVWLATFLYIPQDDPDWLVCDPFGLGDSLWLRKAINRQFEKNNFRELQKRILGMIKKDPDQQEFLAYILKEYNSKAQQTVEFKLTVGIKRWQDIYSLLVGMEINRAKIGDLYSSGQQDSEIKSCLVECQKVGEQVFNYIRPKYLPNNEWGNLSNRDKQGNQQFINNLAKKIGFVVPLPTTLTNVNKNKVRTASEYGNQSLRPHMLAALLATRIFPNHPLYHLAEEHPNILTQLDKLAGLRDDSSHASSRASPTITVAEVDHCIHSIYCLVANILNLPYSPE